MEKLTHLSDLAMLEAAIAESRERPVLLFKHSRTCGVSLEALDELKTYLGDCRRNAGYKMITVQSHRAISDTAAKRLGVRHETPQVILLRDGQPVWSASHFRITAAELERRMMQVIPNPPCLIATPDSRIPVADPIPNPIPGSVPGPIPDPRRDSLS